MHKQGCGHGCSFVVKTPVMKKSGMMIGLFMCSVQAWAMNFDSKGNPAASVLYPLTSLATRLGCGGKAAGRGYGSHTPALSDEDSKTPRWVSGDITPGLNNEENKTSGLESGHTTPRFNTVSSTVSNGDHGLGSEDESELSDWGPETDEENDETAETKNVDRDPFDPSHDDENWSKVVTDAEEDEVVEVDPSKRPRWEVNTGYENEEKKGEDRPRDGDVTGFCNTYIEHYVDCRTALNGILSKIEESLHSMDPLSASSQCINHPTIHAKQ